MNHIKAAYVYDRALPEVSVQDTQMLTHINIAFGLVKNDMITVDHCKNLSFLPTIKEYNPDIKIILSVGGWGAGGFSTAASTEEGRELFAESAAQILRQHSLDGIDIDWEYPCSAAAGIDHSPDDKYNFTLMLQKLREKLDLCSTSSGDRCILSIAAGAGQYFIDNIEILKITQILDFISIMTYDMISGAGLSTQHHTNLYSPKTGDTAFDYNGADAIELFHKAGVPYEKLILGAAFYSRKFENVENLNSGLFQNSKSGALFGAVYDDIQNNFLDKNGFKEYWDDNAKAPYLFDGSTFLSYDNPLSIKYKCEFIKEKGLLGLMYWEHSCNKGRELLSAINENL